MLISHVTLERTCQCPNVQWHGQGLPSDIPQSKTLHGIDWLNFDEFCNSHIFPSVSSMWYLESRWEDHGGQWRTMTIATWGQGFQSLSLRGSLYGKSRLENVPRKPALNLREIESEECGQKLCAILLLARGSSHAVACDWIQTTIVRIPVVPHKAVAEVSE